MSAGTARCGNCALYCGVADLHPIFDLNQRMEPGGRMPAGQCPHCGALAYLVEKD